MSSPAVPHFPREFPVGFWTDDELSVGEARIETPPLGADLRPVRLFMAGSLVGLVELLSLDAGGARLSLRGMRYSTHLFGNDVPRFRKGQRITLRCRVLLPTRVRVVLYGEVSS